MLPQALEIIFEVQEKKRVMKKKKKKPFRITKCFLFFFLLFAFLLLNLITFLFLVHFKQFKNKLFNV
jgi:hypothetical protein